MTKARNSKHYDLEDRTKQFAKDCRGLVKGLSRSLAHAEDGKQLTRSSGSVAANYIEANESLSKKDFVMRIKICRKEAKESCLWLDLLLDTCHNEKAQGLLEESKELTKIFGAILEKSK